VKAWRAGFSCFRNQFSDSVLENSDFHTAKGLDLPWGFQEVEAVRISRQSAHEGVKIVSPKHRPPLSPRKYSWYSFLLEPVSTPGT